MENMENIDESENKKEDKIKSDSDNQSVLQFKIKLPWKNENNLFFLILIIVLITTLPFHYVFQDGIKIIPKDNFTFSNTFVTQHDIDKIIKRYNDESFFGKLEIKKEPLIKKLFENDILRMKSEEEEEREKRKFNQWDERER